MCDANAFASARNSKICIFSQSLQFTRMQCKRMRKCKVSTSAWSANLEKGLRLCLRSTCERCSAFALALAFTFASDV